jgi:hypothetical protein
MGRTRQWKGVQTAPPVDHGGSREICTLTIFQAPSRRT